MPAPIHAIRFPFAIDPALGRLREENDYEAYIAQLVRQVLLTAPGERINRPDFGAGLGRLLFAPNSPATASLARALVIQALDEWLGRFVRTDEVVAEAAGEKLLVRVVYTILARQERRFLNLEVTH